MRFVVMVVMGRVSIALFRKRCCCACVRVVVDIFFTFLTFSILELFCFCELNSFYIIHFCIVINVFSLYVRALEL